MDSETRPAGTIRLAARFGHVSFLLARYFAGLGAARVARLGTPRGRRRERVSTLPALLTDLGPFYIKAGQLLSTRHDLIPPALCGALGRLTDQVPPPSRAEIEQVVRRAYGEPDQWPFASVDWAPLASGSIATVHRAVLRDGRTAAVKVRRPGIARTMDMDLRLAAAGARMAQKLPSQRQAPAEAMVKQVGAAIMHQLDFAAERASLHTLRRNLRTLPAVRLPEPYDELSTGETIVMEFLADLKQFRPEELGLDVRKSIVRTILNAVFRMLFLDGLVHCDLHPGNLYLTEQSDIVILDAGFVVQLSEPVRRQFAEFFMNMAQGRGPRCAQIVIESAAVVPAEFDRAGFDAGVDKLVGETSGALAGEFSLLEFAPRLFRLQQDFGLYAAAEFAFPLLSLLVLEGMIKAFDADVDFQAEAMPVLYQALTASVRTAA
ncbi:MAG TPA: AarF/UbiB family protein [Actinocrinis sp.]|nr:AarF/UbiB family protein [Actinocrinis sp.]